MKQRASVTIVRVVEIDDDPDLSYLQQPDFEHRLIGYMAGNFHHIGVRAKAIVTFHGDNWTADILSPGVWCIESDAPEGHLESAFDIERHFLVQALESLRSFELVEGVANA